MAERPRRAPAREVRRLLADARHTEPMPVDVAARLDRVIADLAGQQEAEPDEAAGRTVTDLAARRRRRVTTLLVAAAAAVAVGVGVDQLASSPTSSSSSAGSADSSAGGPAAQQPSGDAAGDRSGPESFGRETSPSAGSSSARTGSGTATNAPSGEVPVVVPVRVRSDHFSADAARARRLVGSTHDLDSIKGTHDQPRSAYSCERAAWGRGTVVPVRYEHLPAVLVLRPPSGDTQVVDLFRCGTTDLLRSTTLPSR